MRVLAIIFSVFLIAGCKDPNLFSEERGLNESPTQEDPASKQDIFYYILPSEQAQGSGFHGVDLASCAGSYTNGEYVRFHSFPEDPSKLQLKMKYHDWDYDQFLIFTNQIHEKNQRHVYTTYDIRVDVTHEGDKRTVKMSPIDREIVVKDNALAVLTGLREPKNYKKSHLDVWKNAAHRITFEIPTDWSIAEVRYEMDKAGDVGYAKSRSTDQSTYRKFLNHTEVNFECDRIHRGKLVVHMWTGGYLYPDHADVHACYHDFKKWLEQKIKD